MQDDDDLPPKEKAFIGWLSLVCALLYAVGITIAVRSCHG